MIEKKFNFVYLTTNLINGKQYVGEHSTNKIDDKYLGSGRPYLKNAIKEYGRENFKREILEFFPTREEAFNNQEKWIKFYNTHVSKGGYNLSEKGGNNCSGGISEEGRKRISESKKGKKTSLETRQKMSKAKIGKSLSAEHKKSISESEKGRNFSDTHREKLSKSKLGSKNPNFRKPPWNKGIACSEESKRKQIETKLKKLKNGTSCEK